MKSQVREEVSKIKRSKQGTISNVTILGAVVIMNLNSISIFLGEWLIVIPVITLLVVIVTVVKMCVDDSRKKKEDLKSYKEQKIQEKEYQLINDIHSKFKKYINYDSSEELQKARRITKDISKKINNNTLDFKEHIYGISLTLERVSSSLDVYKGSGNLNTRELDRNILNLLVKIQGEVNGVLEAKIERVTRVLEIENEVVDALKRRKRFEKERAR